MSRWFHIREFLFEFTSMDSDICQDFMIIIMAMNLNPTLQPDAFACWWRPQACGVTWDAVPKQSWLLKLLRKPIFFSHTHNEFMTINSFAAFHDLVYDDEEFDYCDSEIILVRVAEPEFQLNFQGVPRSQFHWDGLQRVRPADSESFDQQTRKASKCSLSKSSQVDSELKRSSFGVRSLTTLSFAMLHHDRAWESYVPSHSWRHGQDYGSESRLNYC